ncbi:MAG: hypothetical protein JXR97_14320 [Planctomycetes bacterium]|nr:hypothetical protein [Planctomycetota bacterium]
MSLLSVQSIVAEGIADGTPRQDEFSDHAQNLPAAQGKVDAVSAASGISLQDSVEISGLTAAGSLSGNFISAQSIYSVSASLQFQIMAGRSGGSTQTTTSTNSFAHDFDALREAIGTNLSTAYGRSSTQLADFYEFSDNLALIDPNLSQGLMVMLKTMSDQSPEAAAKAIAALKDFVGNISGMAPANTDNVTSKVVNGSVVINVARSEATVNASFGISEGRGVWSIDVESVGVSISVSGSGINVQPIKQALGDPLILDLKGDGINLRSVEDGVDFDIDGDGSLNRTAFIQGDDALLYLDANGNGTADNGHELFGDQDGDANGFAELGRYDSNLDGLIDAQDEVYDKLRLWQDLNGDGVNQIEESMTLLEAGIESLNTSFEDVDEDDGKGNVISQISEYSAKGGFAGRLADAMLLYYR